MEPDNSAAMAAFRDRAMRRSPVPVPGMPQETGGVSSHPAPTSGGSASGTQGGSEEIDILKQVAGEVTKPELIEVLISRLKKLMPKEGEKQSASPA